MELPTQIILTLAALLAAYAGVDALLRRGYLRAGLTRLGITRATTQSYLIAGTAGVAAPLWSWDALPEAGPLRLLATGLVWALSWRATTRDIDVVTGESHGPARALLLFTASLAWWSPALLVGSCVLLSTPFGMWQHHATLPMRCLQALVAFACLAALSTPAGLPVDASPLVLLLVSIQVSHYVITALAKGYLGPRWYSWPLDNRLHHIAASAYSWGWARFVPWPRWHRLIAATRRVERPLQLAVFALEALCPLSLLHPVAAIGFSLALSAFHLGVFALSGLLFWEWIVTDLLLAATLARLTPETAALAFGPLPLLLGSLVLVLFPLRHRLWRPMPLGWWDTPFTQRMHWVAVGSSGRRYGLYADFMDPHERIYGKVHGCFFAPVPVLTYHLGEAFRHELRDGLRASGGDAARLDALRSEFGVQPRDARLTLNHAAYLQRFGWELNRGTQKHVLPRALRFLKAPGGQCYYWGDLPRYGRQEPIAAIEVSYREEYYDGQVLRRLRDEVVLRVPTQMCSDSPRTAREPTPKELDDHLLSFAAGRLIRLPGMAGGFTRSDDDGLRQP